MRPPIAWGKWVLVALLGGGGAALAAAGFLYWQLDTMPGLAGYRSWADGSGGSINYAGSEGYLIVTYRGSSRLFDYYRYLSLQPQIHQWEFLGIRLLIVALVVFVLTLKLGGLSILQRVGSRRLPVWKLVGGGAFILFYVWFFDSILLWVGGGCCDVKTTEAVFLEAPPVSEVVSFPSYFLGSKAMLIDPTGDKLYLFLFCAAFFSGLLAFYPLAGSKRSRLMLSLAHSCQLLALPMAALGGGFIGDSQENIRFANSLANLGMGWLTNLVLFEASVAVFAVSTGVLALRFMLLRRVKSGSEGPSRS